MPVLVALSLCDLPSAQSASPLLMPNALLPHKNNFFFIVAILNRRHRGRSLRRGCHANGGYSAFKFDVCFSLSVVQRLAFLDLLRRYFLHKVPQPRRRTLFHHSLICSCTLALRLLGRCLYRFRKVFSYYTLVRFSISVNRAAYMAVRLCGIALTTYLPDPFESPGESVAV